MLTDCSYIHEGLTVEKCYIKMYWLVYHNSPGTTLVRFLYWAHQYKLSSIKWHMNSILIRYFYNQLSGEVEKKKQKSFKGKPLAEFKSFVMNNKAFGNLFCNSQNNCHTSPGSSDSNNRGYRSFFKLQTQQWHLHLQQNLDVFFFFFFFFL